ncbi:MAG: hypothetical protein EOP53_18220 [Sphingobacteriales bacterium]|nr:MAG: hypothetical protein EOP53_18220 [Sphingobacteriales bacterium]
MKKSIYILGIILLSLFGILHFTSASTHKGSRWEKGGDKNNKNSESQVRTDGVYFKNGIMKAGSHSGSNYTYLRFYDDGTVVVDQSASKPEQVARIISKKKNEGKGTYKVRNDEISFGMRQVTDYQAYEGKIMSDTLRLTITSSNTGFTLEDNFYFVPLEFKEQ